ncbi:unnamed protein product [Schistosoma margrebowiei]|uniref:Uncharacterized protein n=1 Tax=Schistosoma margrebowiei TaxID=48269 RepID=A0A183L9Z9_9TREM|nr:unnamed protein product [Schistosoma margrebowiei]
MTSFRRTMKAPRPNDPAQRAKLRQNNPPELQIFTISKCSYVYVTNMYVIPDCTSSALSVFAYEFTEFGVTTFNDSLSIIYGDFNSYDCCFLSSLDHQNAVDIPTRLNDHSDLV